MSQAETKYGLYYNKKLIEEFDTVDEAKARMEELSKHLFGIHKIEYPEDGGIIQYSEDLN